MKIVKYRKIFFAISVFTLALSLAATLFFGLRLSIDFSGGELFELASQKNISKDMIEKEISDLGLDGVSVRATNISGAKSAYILRTKVLDKESKDKLNDFFEKESLEIKRSALVGPTVGSELRKKALVAIALTILAIIAFVAWAFREVSKPVKSWYYGLVAILALVHDILIPLGVFAFLGYFFGAEIDTLFVMALLAILGYSVNDTIVIFDRIRERLKRNREKKIKESFEYTVGKALDSTIVRSINTSLTTALVVLSLYFLGAESTKYFALTLLAGVLAGTYSSIFLAAPILLEFAKIDFFKQKEKDNKET